MMGRGVKKCCNSRRSDRRIVAAVPIVLSIAGGCDRYFGRSDRKFWGVTGTMRDR